MLLLSFSAKFCHFLAAEVFFRCWEYEKIKSAKCAQSFRHSEKAAKHVGTEQSIEYEHWSGDYN